MDFSKGVVEFRLKGIDVKKSAQLFTITNFTGDSLNCLITVLKDPKAHKGYRITFEPSIFEIEKDEKTHVKVLLEMTEPPVDDVSILFSVDAQAVKADSEIVKYYLLCTIIPEAAERANLDKTAHMEDILDAIKSHVPNEIVKFFKDRPLVPLNKPVMGRILASILFIDISGFTSLNETLGKIGRSGEGAERVSRHLNHYFGEIIKVVYKHGGDVLKFAGDALICMFTETSSQKKSSKDEAKQILSVLAMRAVQCGLEIQTNLAEYDSNEGFKLSLHIGVSCGPLNTLHVGGVNNSWEFIVTGDPFTQLKTAVDNSKKGEVVVSRIAFALIKDRCEFEPRDKDFLLLSVKKPVEKTPTMEEEVPVQMESVLRCYIQKGLQQKLDSLQMEWLAEVRTVTTLFIKIDGISYEQNKHLDLSLIQKCLCEMQRVIFEYGGMVRQFLVDDKGTVLIAAFGVPVGHEDDQIRGIKTALELNANLQRLKISNSIGITTGTIFCGSVGNKKRQEYA